MKMSHVILPILILAKSSGIGFGGVTTDSPFAVDTGVESDNLIGNDAGAASALYSAEGITSSAILAWDVASTPSGKTVNGVTLGSISRIVVLASPTDSLTSDNIDSAPVLMSSPASYAMDDFTGSGNIFTENGEAAFSGSFTEGENYFIVVLDADNQWFASNPLTAYSSAGWVNTPTGIQTPNAVWQPSSENNAVNTWYTSGYNYIPVPEPASATLALSACAFLCLSRLRRQRRTKLDQKKGLRNEAES